MEKITFNQNEKTLEKLQDVYNNMWDIFLNGDKTSGTKPGNVRAYGTIVGIREVASERIRLRERMLNGEEKNL